MNAVNAISLRESEAAVDVVVVDDDKLTLEIVSWILKDSTYKYELFADHQLAFSYLVEAPPPLLIIDYFMPGINGVDFLLQLKKQSDLTHTKTYLCSAVTPRLSEQQAIRGLDADLLEKQVICSKPALLSIVDQLNSQSTQL